ncbi:MAG TPA: restriction endonuclease subunit S [Bacteroidetes bacterium]|nr:restriction endonuclease subunit S [Bacteroidota bacterium]
MNKEEQKIPALRFPEFEKEREWIETTLEEVADYENGKAHEQEISESGNYKVVNSKFISTDGEVVKYSDSANLKAGIGDILMVLSDVPNGRAIAKCFYVDSNDTYTVNQRICKITPTDIDNKFLFYVQNRNPYFLAFDDGNKQTNLKKDDVLTFPFLKPIDFNEQQKIANCLSSLDEVISAETEKLDLLKDHKKGLLQQLFPAEGEIVPKFRFPEFEGDGDWEEKELGDQDVAIIIMGSSPKSTFYNENNIGLPLLQGNADIQNRKSVPRIYTSQTTKQCKVGDILLSVRAPVGTVAKSFHKACIGRGISAIRATQKTNQEFIYQWLISYEPFWKNISQGGTFESVNSDDIKYLSINLPINPKEQQKIADCLSSVDDLIAAQSDKIESLQEHKKGLMQGLFPKVN